MSDEEESFHHEEEDIETRFHSLMVQVVRRCLHQRWKFLQGFTPKKMADDAPCSEDINTERRIQDGVLDSLLHLQRQLLAKHSHLGMNRLCLKAGRSFSDTEMLVIQYLFVADFLGDDCPRTGRDVLLACAGGWAPFLIDGRALLQRSGMLRTSGLITAHCPHWQNAVNPSTGRPPTLLDYEFTLSESAIRILAHSQDANIFDYEALNLDCGLAEKAFPKWGI